MPHRRSEEELHDRYAERWSHRSRGPSRWHNRQPPPWWPEGEPWPPRRPPWQVAPRRFRRRFVLGALLLLAAFVGFVLLASLAVRAWEHGDRPNFPDQSQRERGPGPLLIVVGAVVVIGGGATALAYRRISRPAGELLGAAEQVAAGDYDVAVRPDGPRSLRLLTIRFNDMARRLAANEEQRRRFLADVTHELRTPLAVLQSEVEAQLDGVRPRDDAHLGSLLEEIQRLGRLVDDLHTLALAEAGRIVLHREPVAPAMLAEDAVAAHTTLAQRNQVTLRTEITADLPTIDVDASRIRQVLDNLLANAIRHTPAGGEVVVQVEPGTPPQVRFTVTDTGPGFPPDQLGRLFDRFARPGDASGSGLGLSIAHDLVQAHGGAIHAANHTTTGGATISFTL
jgi:two-component system, OmpR family, sensor histidine kinase BaeS